MENAHDRRDRTIYVTNLEHDVTDDHLYSLFSQVGPIEKLIFKAAANGDPLHALIVFRHISSVLDALTALSNADVNGKPISIRPLRESTHVAYLPAASPSSSRSLSAASSTHGSNTNIAGLGLPASDDDCFVAPGPGVRGIPRIGSHSSTHNLHIPPLPSPHSKPPMPFGSITVCNLPAWSDTSSGGSRRNSDHFMGDSPRGSTSSSLVFTPPSQRRTWKPSRGPVPSPIMTHSSANNSFDFTHGPLSSSSMGSMGGGGGGGRSSTSSSYGRHDSFSWGQPPPPARASAGGGMAMGNVVPPDSPPIHAIHAGMSSMPPSPYGITPSPVLPPLLYSSQAAGAAPSQFGFGGTINPDGGGLKASNGFRPAPSPNYTDRRQIPSLLSLQPLLPPPNMAPTAFHNILPRSSGEMPPPHLPQSPIGHSSMEIDSPHNSPVNLALRKMPSNAFGSSRAGDLERAASRMNATAWTDNGSFGQNSMLFSSHFPGTNTLPSLGASPMVFDAFNASPLPPGSPGTRFTFPAPPTSSGLMGTMNRPSSPAGPPSSSSSVRTLFNWTSGHPPGC